MRLARIKPEDLLNDRQVAAILGMSHCTLSRKMCHGFNKGELDLRQARPLKNGRHRIWLRQDVERIIRKRITVE